MQKLIQLEWVDLIYKGIAKCKIENWQYIPFIQYEDGSQYFGKVKWAPRRNLELNAPDIVYIALNRCRYNGSFSEKVVAVSAASRHNMCMLDEMKKLTEEEEANIQKLVKSYNDFYGKSDVVYKTESEMYEEYCDEEGLL